MVYTLPVRDFEFYPKEREVLSMLFKQSIIRFIEYFGIKMERCGTGEVGTAGGRKASKEAVSIMQGKN